MSEPVHGSRTKNLLVFYFPLCPADHTFVLPLIHTHTPPEGTAVT